jgi:hypothetical protein
MPAKLEGFVVGAKEPPPPWDGIERRLGPADRRANKHDRRWETCHGRRYHVLDRRKTAANARWRR